MSFVKSIVLGILLSGTWSVSAQSYVSTGAYVSVTSTNDGNGLFSYTFNLGGLAGVWGVATNNGGIYLQSYGILNIFSPAGWIASVDANDFITWQPTNGTAFLGQPSLTFLVQSSSTDAVLYNQANGMVFGTVYTLPNLHGIGGGYETFAYLGPQAVPEPSSLALLASAAFLASRLKKNHS